MSYFKKLLTPGLALVLLLVSGYVINLAYQRTAQASLYLSDRILKNIGEMVIDQTNLLFSTTEAQLALNLSLAESGLNSEQDLLQSQQAWLKLLWKQLHLNKNLDGIYLADNKGGFLIARRTPRLSTSVMTRKGDQITEKVVYREANFQPIAHIDQDSDYDPRTRPWYQNAAESQDSQPVWSKIYRFVPGNQTGLSASVPFRNERGELLGVFAADITLDGLTEFISRQTFGEFDLASIINTSNELVAYPMRLNLQEETVVNDNLLPTLQHVGREHVWVKTAWQLYNSKGAEEFYDADEADKTLSFIHENERYISVLFNMPDNFPLDWKLLVVAPEDELMGNVNRSINENLLITLLVIIFSGLIFYLMATRLVRRKAEKS